MIKKACCAIRGNGIPLPVRLPLSPSLSLPLSLSLSLSLCSCSQEQEQLLLREQEQLLSGAAALRSSCSQERSGSGARDRVAQIGLPLRELCSSICWAGGLLTPGSHPYHGKIQSVVFAPASRGNFKRAGMCGKGSAVVSMARGPDRTAEMPEGGRGEAFGAEIVNLCINVFGPRHMYV